MCTVLAWNGQLPQGLLTSLLIEAESRGRDSTGVAFRATDTPKPQTVTYRRASSARAFTKENSKNCGEARRSKKGIAHTRRASPGMPIDPENAHPFHFQKFVFAHNGKIDNWRELKDAHLATARAEQNAANTTYFQSARTDSMVLGPAIVSRDFSNVVGCMGLVWMHRDEVYCMRAAKELAAAHVTWAGEPAADGTPATPVNLTIVASTPEIIENALRKVPKVTVAYDFIPVDEGVVYRLTEEGLVAEGTAPLNQANHADDFSSGIDAATAALALQIVPADAPAPREVAAKP